MDLEDLGPAVYLDDGQCHGVTDAQCVTYYTDHSGYSGRAIVAGANECPDTITATYHVR